MSVEATNQPALQLTSPCWKTLPIELIGEILDYAAQTSTQSCLNLNILSSWARRLAAKHLYHTLIVSRSTFSGIMDTDHHRDLRHKDGKQRPATALKVAQLIQSCWFHDSEPDDFTGAEIDIVKTLQVLVAFWTRTFKATADADNWMDRAIADLHRRDNTDWDNLRFTDILKCDNLAHLSLTPVEFACLVILGAAPFSRETSGFSILNRDLQATLQITFDSDLDGYNELYNDITTCSDDVINSFWNPTVTHLVLVGYPVYTGTPLCISHLRRLSHLAIPFYGLPEQQLTALETWALEVPTSQVLVILVYEDLLPNDTVADLPQRQVVEDWVDSHKDHRVQVRIWPCDSRAVREDWEEVTRGAPSIWERALGRRC